MNKEAPKYEEGTYMAGPVLLGLMIIFALQNMAVIQVNFLGLGFETRRIFLILVCLVIGFALGKSINLRRLGR
ncbi:MAG: LapA family protein [Pseudomonadota bacterium]|nr:LapA family protein [Pseudomonadota bacterium]